MAKGKGYNCIVLSGGTVLKKWHCDTRADSIREVKAIVGSLKQRKVHGEVVSAESTGRVELHYDWVKGKVQETDHS